MTMDDRDRPLAGRAVLAAGVLLLLAAGAVLAQRFLASPHPARPDVLLLTVDTLRADRLGAYGYEKARTPNIDALARRGVLFTEATTPFPRTTPALASLLTGLWPQNHGSREVGQNPRRDATLLPEILKELGYLTLGVSANGAAGRNQGLDRGFDHFVDAHDLRAKHAKQVARRALALLRHAEPGVPLFLWVHTIDPHFPYRVHDGFPEPPDAGVCRDLIATTRGNKQKTGHVTSDLGGRSSRALASCSALYDAEVAYTDRHVGVLLDGYDALGRDGEPLVVFTADHGENLGEDGLFYQHGPNVHDASLKVPLIIAGPGIRPGVDDGVARLEDLVPTILELLGESPRRWAQVDGESFARRLGRWAWTARGGDRAAYAESGSALLVHSYRYLHSGRSNELHCLNGPRFALCGRPGEAPGLYDHAADPELQDDLSADYPEVKARLLRARELWPPEQPRERTIRTPRYKLVERPRLRGGYDRALYDLETDPLAQNDVSRRHPEVAARLGERLDRWTASLPSFAVEERSEDQLETLRALGYID